MKRLLINILFASLLLTSCKHFDRNKGDYIDPYRKLDREDYMKITRPKNDNEKEKNLPPLLSPTLKLPDIKNLTTSPKKFELENNKLVSVSVNENVPLKEVLLEICRKAEVDVEIDQDIDGKIIFIAHEKPFSEVIERIAKMADLNYKFENGVLKITKDYPFVRTYRFNMLDITRTANSNVNASISVGGSGATGGANASVNSGSSNNLTITGGDGNFWGNLEMGIFQILNVYGQEVQRDEKGKRIQQQAGAGGMQGGMMGGGMQGGGMQGGQGGAGGMGMSMAGMVAPNGASILSANRNAGIVTILANQKQHDAIKEFLDSIHISMTSQVLIEAKVVEVSLKDEYSSGINWSLVTAGGNFVDGGTLNLNYNVSNATSDIFKFSVLPSELFGNEGNTLQNSVNLLQLFGVTRSLSNPRISTLNNQTAVLNFSKNEVYFTVSLGDQQTNSGIGGVDNRNVSISSEIKTVPIGMILTIQPSIDLQRNEITMHVRPTLTKVSDRVDDPSIILIKDRLDSSTAINSRIPVVEVKELDTVLRTKSGDVMMIGGLLEDKGENTDQGVPGISSIPLFGNAFKSVIKKTNLTETVILIKPTIVPGQGITVEDREFYDKFGKTKRKFFNDE
ncbi:MAG: hypothetical protein SFT90_00120 [Rickettsiales bacterium]|nr:hypothetical protein [Rickettsiales bacterium]